MSKFDEIADARTGLGNDFQALSDLTIDLNTRIAEAQAGVAKLESHAAALQASAADRIAAFDTLLVTQSALLSDRLGELNTNAGTAHSDFAAALSAMQALWTTMETGLKQLTEQAGTMATQTLTIGQETLDTYAGLVAGIAKDAGVIDGDANRFSALVGQLDGQLLNLEKDWSALLGDIAKGLDEGNAAIADLLKDQLDDTLGSFADNLRTALEHLAETDVRQLTEDARNEMAQKLEETLTGIADQAITALQEGLETAIKEILGSKTLTDEQREMMMKLIEPIQPMIEDFIGKVLEATGIWRMVEPFM